MRMSVENKLVNVKGDKDYTALHNATRNGHTALVRLNHKP